jgi:hypothetical protein
MATSFRLPASIFSNFRVAERAEPGPGGTLNSESQLDFNQNEPSNLNLGCVWGTRWYLPASTLPVGWGEAGMARGGTPPLRLACASASASASVPVPARARSYLKKLEGASGPGPTRPGVLADLGGVSSLPWPRGPLRLAGMGL